jgi:MarR family transcriptional regulator, 2-MHQ and catechol-resistance regulon repressor
VERSPTDQVLAEQLSDQPLNAKNAAKQPFVPVMRELVRAYQAFESYTDENVRQLGLTSPQFDVIATLGNTTGMTMNTLAEKTLVTKGTLTGIVDRLEKKGFVRREVPEGDRRCFVIVLTPEGEQLFEQVFPAQIAYIKERFDKLDSSDLEEILSALKKLRSIF